MNTTKMNDITSQYLESQGLNDSFQDRFWKKVLIVPYDAGCWIWLGYGRIGDSDKFIGYGVIFTGTWKPDGTPLAIGAHRASWVLHYGPIPEGLYVMHKCDNPLCVRPDHLRLGTATENCQDKLRKGRANPPAGERCAMHKMTEPEVIEIRRLYSAGGISLKNLGLRFGLGQTSVMAIVHRKTWKHI